jgi:hypothetical protein
MKSQRRYDWDGMQIGETRMFQFVFRSAVATSFADYAKRRGLNWACTTRSEPPTPKRGMPCDMVWVTRIEPRGLQSGVSIPEPDGPAMLTWDEMVAALRHEPKAKVRPDPFVPVGHQKRKGLWIIDLKDIPRDERKAIYESRNARVRLSKRGWDRMRLDEFKIVRTQRKAIWDQVITACASRGLNWRFHVIRCAPPESERNGPYANDVWYAVRRVL